jgi:hypothetical protein
MGDGVYEGLRVCGTKRERERERERERVHPFQPPRAGYTELRYAASNAAILVLAAGSFMIGRYFWRQGLEAFGFVQYLRQLRTVR